MDAGNFLNTLLSDVTPIAVVIVIGWSLGWTGLFSDAEARAVNRMALFVAAPALVFGLMASVPLAEIDLRVSLGYLISELAVYAITFFLARRGFGADRQEALLLGMSAAFVNHVYFVLPVAENAYGAVVRAPIMSLITIDSVVLFTGTVVLMDMFQKGRLSATSGLRAGLKMPYVLAIFAGLVFNLFGLTMPAGLATFTGYLGAAASPAALFAMGVVLSNTVIFRWDSLAVTVALIKLVLHPALAILVFSGILTLPAVSFQPALLVAAGPAGFMAMALALHYNVSATTLGRVIVLTTIGSVLGLSLLI